VLGPRLHLKEPPHRKSWLRACTHTGSGMLNSVAHPRQLQYTITSSCLSDERSLDYLINKLEHIWKNLYICRAVSNVISHGCRSDFSQSCPFTTTRPWYHHALLHL
jgi:hypothetical protein